MIHKRAKNLDEVRNSIVEAGLVKYASLDETFTFKSGQKSNIYFDMRAAISYPFLLEDIAFFIYKQLISPLILEGDDETCIAGVPMGGIAYSVALSRLMSLPAILVREEVKKYGLQKRIEGTPRKYVILIEDVSTTGQSTLDIINILEQEGHRILMVLCVIDRGGVANIREKGYKTVRSLFTAEDFMPHPLTLKMMEISKRKNSKLVIALDTDNPNESLEIIEKTHHVTVAYKIHIDAYIFCDSSISKMDFIYCLNDYKEKYNFLVIEDRKFADIPSISVRQLMNTYINHVADIVTVHGITGPDIVKELGDRIPILLIHQLSTRDNLITEQYSEKIIEYAKQSKNVVGFISQSKVKDNRGNTVSPYITFSPGINLDAPSDGKGQVWSNHKDTDFFIVGRGIILADNIKGAAERYASQLM